MYPATDHLPTDAHTAQGDTQEDAVAWYVRKFRLETAEGEARADAALLEVPEVRSRKWMLAVAAVVLVLSAVLALATYAVSG